MISKPRILGLGEILWDVFPDGPRFGGAPANFACSAAGLSGGADDVGMISAVGADDLGTAALQALHEHRVDTVGVSVNERPTGQVLVQLDDHGHATYEFAADVAWDHIVCVPELEQLASTASVICFGTLGQRSARSRAAIRQILAASGGNCLRIFDINLRPPFWSAEVIHESFQYANALKLNDDELSILAHVLELPGAPIDQLKTLLMRYNLRLIALTRGEAGALLLNAQGDISDLPGMPTQVIDTVGAGDSFTAALALGWLRGLALDDINRWASRIAAFVCSQPGATPTIPEELRLGNKGDAARVSAESQS